jgi:hypothetical protein
MTVLIYGDFNCRTPTWPASGPAGCARRASRLTGGPLSMTAAGGRSGCAAQPGDPRRHRR